MYVESCFLDWGLREYSVDNVSLNDLAIEYLKQCFMGNVLGENICIQDVVFLF